MSGAKEGWESAWAELAALLSVMRCESRELFEDRAIGGVALGVGREGRPLAWAVFEPQAGSVAARLDLVWSVAQDLSEHRFEASARALLALERRLREGLEAEAPGARLRERLLGQPGAMEARLPGARWQGKKGPAMMHGAQAWSRLASAFEPRSSLFREGLLAFDRDGLIQGGGRALMESDAIGEHLGPAKAAGGSAKGL